MKVKIPNGMRSPTVIIVSQGTMNNDDKLNKFHEKQMDLLEKKFDEKYRDLINKIKEVKTNKNFKKEYFNKKDLLEEVIKKNLLRPKNISLTKLENSFEKMFAKIQKEIESVKPRVYPSPS